MSTTLIVLEITIEKLIGHLIYDNTSHNSKNELMHQIFGTFQDKIKKMRKVFLLTVCLNLEMG